MSKIDIDLTREDLDCAVEISSRYFVRVLSHQVVVMSSDSMNLKDINIPKHWKVEHICERKGFIKITFCCRNRESENK